MTDQEAVDTGSWQEALDSAAALFAAVRALHENEERTLELLRGALRNYKERGEALLLLGVLDPTYTLALTDILIEQALSQRDALYVRRLFGRLAYHQIEDVVPAAVLRLLEETGDDDAYRRMAELLSHLGLMSAVRLICDQALDSEDPNVREVGAEFRGSTD